MNYVGDLTDFFNGNEQESPLFQKKKLPNKYHMLLMCRSSPVKKKSVGLAQQKLLKSITALYQKNGILIFSWTNKTQKGTKTNLDTANI